MTAMEVGDLQFDDPSGEQQPAEPPPQDRRRQALLAGAAAAVVALAAGLWLFLGGGSDDSGDAPPVEVAAETAEPSRPAAPIELSEPELEPEPIELPALAESDDFVRELVEALLAHPNLASWLAGNDLLRRFVVSVDNVANGRNPAQQMPTLRPDRRFRSTGDEQQALIDPASYQRYDLFARVVGALDPSAVALLYTTLEPLLDESHAELGYPDTPFRQNLERAVRHLLAAPVVDTPPVVVRRATQYLYADERLESLTPAQKQFLGMGPDNVGVVQAQLRAVSGEIGLTVE